MIWRGLSIFGWTITIISLVLVVFLCGYMIYLDSEMDLFCGMDDGYYHSGECKDLGSVGRVAVLAIGFFLILASIRPAIHLVIKSRRSE